MNKILQKCLLLWFPLGFSFDYLFERKICESLINQLKMLYIDPLVKHVTLNLYNQV